MGTKNKPGTFDCYTNAHPDEPMFILLGRDPAAADLVDEWAIRRAKERGPSAKVDEAHACATAMRAWQERPAEDQRQHIVINGKSIETDGKALSYADVVRLAEMTGAPSIKWRIKARAGLASGMMHHDSFGIVPSDGMVFNVCHTGGA